MALTKITGNQIQGLDTAADATAITIDSSERVGIGTASPAYTLNVNSGSTVQTAQLENQTTSSYATTDGGIDNILSLFSTGTSATQSVGISFYCQKAGETGAISEIGAVRISSGNSALVFRTRDSATGRNERMRIDNNGNLLVGTTTNNVVIADAEGISIQEDASIQANTSGSTIPCRIGRLGTDGTLIEFRGQTLVEGSISVSGATVAYNGFTGTHWSRFTDNSKPTILKGTVLESLDEMCDWYNLEFDVTTQDEDGNDVTTTKKVSYVLQDGQSVGDVITYDWNTEKKDENDNDIIEQVQATIVKEADIKHVKSKVSDTVDAKNVYGVFMAYDEDGEGYNDFYVASVGSFVVRIKANETIVKGDLLQSNGDGTAKVQTDDAIRASTFAKVLSTTVIETYEDGSFLVPCSLMC